VSQPGKASRPGECAIRRFYRRIQHGVVEIVVRERRLIDLALDPFRNIGG
jgi:hypothetical protein